MTTIEDNKTLVREFIDALFSNGDLAERRMSTCRRTS